MNDTAKRLREVAGCMKDYGVTSAGAIVRVRDTLGVSSNGMSFAADLGAVLDYIADELDELDDKAARRMAHIVQLESTISERNRELRELRGKVPAERERQILDMWPKFEDGAYVWLGDRFADNKGEPREIEGITLYSHGIDLYDDEGFHKPLDHGERLKRPVRSVLDADGVEIKVGDTVWCDEDNKQCEVIELVGGTVRVRYQNGYTLEHYPSYLTHARPDSWERLEMDAELNDETGIVGGNLDIVRRAKALAGVEVD